MPDPQTVQVTLEVEVASEPIAGVVKAATGDDRAFCGWTDLASTLAWALRVSSSYEDLTAAASRSEEPGAAAR